MPNFEKLTFINLKLKLKNHQPNKITSQRKQQLFKGSFNDYVEKKRWVGGQNCLFLSMFRVTIVHVEVGQKGQNCVQVVIEWPSTIFKQILYYFMHYFTFQVNNLIAIGFFIICIFLVILPIIDDPQLVGVALGIMVSGVPIYIFFIHWKNKPVWLKNIVHTWDVAVQKVFLAIPTE